MSTEPSLASYLQSFYWPQEVHAVVMAADLRDAACELFLRGEIRLAEGVLRGARMYDDGDSPC